MIIIRLMGGLGNQMFQYALYRTLLARGKEVKIDDVSGYVNDSKRVPALRETFGVDYVRATPEEVTRFSDASRDFMSRLRRRLLGSRSKLRGEKQEGNFEPEIPEADDVFLNGYWQTEKYFADPEVQSHLRSDFELDPSRIVKNQQVWEILGQIRNTESVGLHIRRGDYVEPGFVEVYGGICTEDYYRKAVEYILERAPRAVFYLFSDDREWTKEHFGGARFVTVSEDEALTDTEDLLLMSACRHNIIANSSFSWWASWLNANPDRIVVAPEKWLNTKDIRDIYTDRMVRL